jgi:hypothetical protein
MVNKHFDILLEKYRIALQRLECTLGQIDKKPAEDIIEKQVEVVNTKLDELSNEIVNLLAELNRKDEIIASLTTGSLRNTIDVETAIQEDNENSIVPSFGTQFPSNPLIGQQFLRVDTNPNKLYKFNGNKWILVDRKLNSSYTIDKKLAEYMINALKKGELEWDDLTDAEQNVIKPYLTKEKNLGR